MTATPELPGPAETPDAVARVREALRGVYDPELALDIVSLGLVYDVRLEDGSVVVDMTLTTPGCPVSESLPQQALEAAFAALAGTGVGIELRLVWEPEWTPERLSDDAAAMLGFRTGRE
ncbi:MAG: iron-sulfur cluster assembly protein [Acidimicrobiia bacterium]